MQAPRPPRARDPLCSPGGINLARFKKIVGGNKVQVIRGSSDGICLTDPCRRDTVDPRTKQASMPGGNVAYSVDTKHMLRRNSWNSITF